MAAIKMISVRYTINQLEVKLGDGRAFIHGSFCETIVHFVVH